MLKTRLGITLAELQIARDAMYRAAKKHNLNVCVSSRGKLAKRAARAKSILEGLSGVSGSQALPCGQTSLFLDSAGNRYNVQNNRTRLLKSNKRGCIIEKLAVEHKRRNPGITPLITAPRKDRAAVSGDGSSW